MNFLNLAVALMLAQITANVSATPPRHRPTVVTAPTISVNDQIFELAREGVRGKLKDPDSANFRNLIIHKGESPKDGRFYVCGEVNSKNSYGGYVGFTPFFSMIFWYEKQGVGIEGFTSIWNSNADQAGMAAFFAPNCVN